MKPKRGGAERFYRQWSFWHDYCQCCGVSAHRASWPGLSTHHIVKFGRVHAACNLLRLCHRCHSLAEGLTVRDRDGNPYPKLTLGICLWLKGADEPEDFDLDHLSELYGRNLPDLEPVPWCFEREWLSCHRKARLR